MTEIEDLEKQYQQLLLDQLKRVREEVVDHLNDGNFETIDVLTELRQKLDKMMEELTSKKPVKSR